MTTEKRPNPFYLDLSRCSYLDQKRFKSRLRKLKQKQAKDGAESVEQSLAELAEKVSQAEKRLAARFDRALAISYPENLPVSQKADQIKEAIENHQVVIVAGETGSGKTTQLPKICLQCGLGRRGLIGHTQPRRLAARTVSTRIAEELNSQLGDVIGYQVRFTDQVSDQTFVKVMTDGILLAEIKHDRDLLRYDTLIIDEAHERSLNIDFLLGYLKQLLPRRPELKVVITSATIDVERFSKHFHDAPVVTVSGRTFPVDVHYRPGFENEEESVGLPEQIYQVLEEIGVEEKSRGWRTGDVLVFLPGEREIREVSNYLRHQDLPNTEIAPLYARLSNEEQNRIFRSHAGRRVVLSTNVAETSITVPGIRYVIDSGLVRMSRYSYRSKIQRLPIEAISQASANQRKGRCGRVAEGICYRLYSEEDFDGRPEFTDPEILRTNLASVILKMQDAGLGEVYQFTFIDPPDRKLWNDGFKLLFELEAVDDKNKLTRLGRQLAGFPVDPRLARMLISASELGCLEEMLVIVSALSIQDPRERPSDKKGASDQAHSQYRDKESDFVTVLNLWRHFEEQRQALSGNQLKKHCKKQFLNYLRMREWRDLHRQLVLMAQSLKPNSRTAKTESAEGARQANQADSLNYDALHQAILSGFLGQVGRFEEKREFKGCRNRKFQIFPGSGLVKSKVKWLVSAELVETQQVYARMNARIDPAWIEPLASHLVKKRWSEPHWQKKRGQVLAYESVTIYGLEIVSKRLVNFGQIDVQQARDIFIRSALVEGELDTRAPEIRQNRELIASLEAIEDRSRRRDILVDEERVYELYEQAIPAHIVSAASFEKWLKGQSKEERQRLCFKKEDLAQSHLDHFDPSLYPDTLENNGIQFPLSYCFDPTSDQDGVTISVPLRAARQVSGNRLEKLVPGLLRDKCIALIKNLPRSLRKHFVPVPDVVDSIYPAVESSDAPLLEALSKALKKKTNVEVPYASWNLELLENYLRFNIEVLDDAGKVMERGRDLATVIDKVDALIEKAPPVAQRDTKVDQKHKTWDFGTLDESRNVQQAGIQMRVFPALEEAGDWVKLIHCSDAPKAEQLTRLGVARLLSFKLSGQINSFPKALPEYKKLGLLYAPVGQARDLYDDFALFAVATHFKTDDIPRTEEAFLARYEAHRGDFVERAIELCALVHDVMQKMHSVTKLMKGKVSLEIALPLSDLQFQLEQLVSPGFLRRVNIERLEQYPRYLEACQIRFEKMPREMAREREYVPVLKEWWQQYEGRKKQFDQQGIWCEELERFRWLIEEQRVSWYAQQLGTLETVSQKRLNREWESVRRT